MTELKPSNSRGRPPQWGFAKSAANLLAKLVFFVAIFVVWEVGVVVFKVPYYILPSPVSIAQSIYVHFNVLLNNSWSTVYETTAGFLLGSGIGLGFALVVAFSRFLRSTLYPLMVVLNSFPKIAIAPLLLIWFGFGIESKVMLSAFASFFPVFINATTGLVEVESEILFLAKSMSATSTQVFAKVRLPHALPSIFNGLRIAMPLSMIGAVVGEFVGANTGLGYLLLLANDSLNTPLVFGCLVFMVLFSLILFYVVVVFEKRLLKWRPSAQRQ